jgi:hypothetical protein
MNLRAKKLLVLMWMETIYPQFTGQIFAARQKFSDPVTAYALPVLIR